MTGHMDLMIECHGVLFGKILGHDLSLEFDHLILDETQDYSADDLRVMRLIAENITVFADGNQRINDSAVDGEDEIMELLDIDDM